MVHEWRALGTDVEMGFDTGDKLSISLVVGDGVEESCLFGSTKTKKKGRRVSYALVRTADRFLAHIILLSVLCLGIWKIVREVQLLRPWVLMHTTATRVLAWTIVAFLLLTVFRLAEYCVIRLDRVFDAFENDRRGLRGRRLDGMT
jgi:hypothetical protein